MLRTTPFFSSGEKIQIRQITTPTCSSFITKSVYESLNAWLNIKQSTAISDIQISSIFTQLIIRYTYNIKRRMNLFNYY